MNKETVDCTIRYRLFKRFFLKVDIITWTASDEAKEEAENFLYDHADEFINKVGFRRVKLDVEDGVVTHAYVRGIKEGTWDEFEFKELEE